MSLLLSDVLPALAVELEVLLRIENEPELADQVASLEMIDRCRCGDDFCATFYTVQKPNGAWGKNHCTLPLEPENGMIIIDILNGKIAEVEILFRDEIREKVLGLLP